MEKLHLRLQRLRKARGIPLKDLAQRIGVPASTYREWEYGSSIQGEPYVKIADALNVGLRELLTGEKPLPDQTWTLVSKLETDIECLKKHLIDVLGDRRNSQK